MSKTLPHLPNKKNSLLAQEVLYSQLHNFNYLPRINKSTNLETPKVLGIYRFLEI